MTQTIKLYYGAPRTTENVNKRLLDILESGVYRGYKVRAQSPATMDLDINRESDPLSVLIAEEGAVISESTDLVSAVTIPASDPTDLRIDLVCAFYQHTFANNPQTYVVVQGVAAPSPVKPALPLYHVELASVLVPAGATSITDNDITNVAMPSLVKPIVAEITLTGGDISAKEVALPIPPSFPETVLLHVTTGPVQRYGYDYIISSGNINWNGLALDGVLVAGNVLLAYYF